MSCHGRRCWRWPPRSSIWCWPARSRASRGRFSRSPMPPRRIARWSRARRWAPRCWCHDRLQRARREPMNLDMNAAPAGARDEYIIGRGAAWFAFAMTMALMLFDYIDRQVIVSLFPYLKAEWALSDKQLGLLV